MPLKALVTTPLIVVTTFIRNFFFRRVVINENRGLQNLRKSQFWQFAAICSNLLQIHRLPMHAPALSMCS
jgi:hypothetical protein